MTLDLDHLSKLADAATPGPWMHGSQFICQDTDSSTMRLICQCLVGDFDSTFWRTNAELVVELRNNVQELIRLARLGMKVEPG